MERGMERWREMQREAGRERGRAYLRGDVPMAMEPGGVGDERPRRAQLCAISPVQSADGRSRRAARQRYR